MPIDPNTQTDDTGWPVGQPAPWLAQYGAAPDATTAPTSVVDGSAAPNAPAMGAAAPMAPVPMPADPNAIPSATDASAPNAPGAPGAPGATPSLGAPASVAPVPTLAPDGSVQPNASPMQPNASPQQDATAPFQPSYLGPPGAVPLDAGIAGSGTEAQAQTDQTNANAATNPDAPLADRQRAWNQLTPDQRTNLVNSGDPKQLAAVATAAMSPEELATIQLRHTQQQIHEQSAAQLDLAVKTDQQAQQNFATYTTALTKANSDTDDVSKQAQALSQQKIDTGEHGVGHFIGSVLTAAFGGFAAPATGGKNLALDELDKQTERRIQAQKDSIANQWQGLQFKRNLIQEQLQRSGDLYKAQEIYRVSQYDRATSELQTRMQDYDPRGTTALRIAGTLQQIGTARAQALQAFGQQQFTNHITALKAQNEADTLRQKAFNDQQVNSLGWANYTREKTDAAAKNQIERDKLAEQQAQRLATQGQAQQERDIKEVVNDPATGAPLLAPEGQAMVSQAKQLDAQAASATDPAAQQKLAAQAAQLRSQAVTQHAVRRGDPTEHQELQGQLNASQGFIDTAERLKQILAGDPSSFDRETFAKATTEYERAKQQYVQTFPGTKLSTRTVDVAVKTIAGDPSSYISRVKDRNEMIASLDELENGVSSDAATALRGAGQQAPKGGTVWTPKISHVEAIEPLSGKTAVEAGQDARLNTIYKPLSLTTNDERATNAENSGDFGRTGLSRDDTATVDKLVGRFGKASSDEDRERIAGQLAAYASSPRVPIASGVVGLVRSDPAAYKAMLDKLPPDRRAAIVDEDTQRSAALGGIGTLGAPAGPTLDQLRAQVGAMSPDDLAKLKALLNTAPAGGAR